MNDDFHSPRTIAELLTTIAHADPVNGSKLVCEWVAPRLETWLCVRPVDPVLFTTILSAARDADQIAMIARIASGFEDIFWQLRIDAAYTALLRNVLILDRLPGGSLTSNLPQAGERKRWVEALSAPSEPILIKSLDRLMAGQPDSDVVIGQLVSFAALARTLAWNSAYRHAQRLLVEATPSDRFSHLIDQWCKHGLPVGSGMSLVSQAKRRVEGYAAEANWQAAIERFEASQNIEAATDVWSLAHEQGRLGTMIRGAPLSRAARDRVAQRIVADPPHRSTPVWVFMTWREGADRLLGMIANYLDANTQIVVSVGGDGHPDRLERASAILLADRTYMVARPVVTWGGQKLLFQNMLPVLEAFYRQTEGTAWFSVVCDRSFPLHGLARLSERLSDQRLMARSAMVEAPPAWHREWDQATVDDLPTQVTEAVGELFASGTARRLLSLVGQDVAYLPPGNYRLDQCHFNFAATARSVSGESLSAQTYAISPFNPDFRWMSLARLTEFVDTGSEGGATYARSLHPWLMHWVHSVLKKYDLRIGDPFFVASRAYTEHLFKNPDRFDLFAAMNSGLGPEMNFFDTYASSNNLLGEFHHLFSRQPVAAVGVEVLEPVFDHADAHGMQYVRKITNDPDDELLKQLSRRIMDDAPWEDFHWAVGVSTDQSEEAYLPCLSPFLMALLVGRPFVIRDLLDRRQEIATLDVSGEVKGDGRLLGHWQYSDGVLTLTFLDGLLGQKNYRSIGSDAERLTLVPDEIVNVYNSWSAFLEFTLSTLSNNDAVVACLNIADILLGNERSWFGGPKEESNMIAAFTSAPHSPPLPSFTHAGQALEIRRSDQSTLVLARIKGQPALLRLRGAASADGCCVALLSTANDIDLEDWSTMSPDQPIFELKSEGVVGRWMLETFEGAWEIRLCPDGEVVDEKGALLGRWLARTGGLYLIGLDQLRLAYASQARLRDGCWRLSGWANRNMQERQSFAIRQLL